MKEQDIIDFRLVRQQLSDTKCTTPEELVHWMGCIQAQDFAGAKWAIGSRLKDISDSGGVSGAKGGGEGWKDSMVENAFREGRIIRTHVLRPTWHFVTPADIRWMLALSAPRVKASMALYHKQLELNPAIFRRSNTLLQKALKGGKSLNRREIAALLQRQGIVTNDTRLSHLLMEAELDGIICSAGLDGKQFSYALLEERVPPHAGPKGEQAIAELALRYFRSRGPATAADFAWWSGLTIADAKTGIEAYRPQYNHCTLNGKTYWYLPGAYDLPSAGSTHQMAPSGSRPRIGSTDPQRDKAFSGSDVIHVLPAYDEYTVAYTHRDLVVPAAYAERSGNGIFKPLVVRNGRIAGTWQRTIKKDSVVIATDLFKPIGKKALKDSFAGYGAFIDRKVVFDSKQADKT